MRHEFKPRLWAVGAILGAPLFLGLLSGVASAAISITTRTGTLIEGQLDGGAANFRAEKTTSNEVTVQVTIGSLVLDALGDLDGSGALISVSLNGYGVALTNPDKTTLITLSNELEVVLQPITSLPVHEDLLQRLVGYWAEAPVGLPIGSSTVTPP